MELSFADNAINRIITAVGKIPGPLRKKLAGKPRTVDGQQIHPDVQLALKVLASEGTFETKPVAEGRAELDTEAAQFGARRRCVYEEMLAVPTRSGAVLAKHYRRGTASENLGTVMYLHGGGWVLGGIGSAEAVCRVIADRTGLDVVNVDYRLAPEHKFPAGVEDAVDAFRWLRDHHDEIGVHSPKIAVAGESAGGNLTAVVGQITKRDDGGAPDFLCPIFPVTDLSTKHESYRTFSKGFFLTEAQMDWYKAHYLSDPAEATDPRVSPLLSADFSGQAPTLLVLAGLDPLRDEGREYGYRLQEAGVDVEILEFEGFIHAFINATAPGKEVVSRVEKLADRIAAGIRR